MTEPLRVAFVIGQLGVGGGEKQLYLLLRGLDRSRFECSVITFHPDAGDFWEEPIGRLGVPIVGVPRRRPRALRAARLLAALRRSRPHVVVSWSLHLNLPAALLGRLAGARLTVGSIRNDLFNPAKPERSRQRLFGTRGAHLFVANSTRGRRDLIERLGLDPGRVVVVFNALPADGAPREPRDDVRGRLGLPADAFFVVNVGRLEPSKNQTMLLRAAARLAARAPDLHVVLFGEGPDRARLTDLARELGIADRVHVPGLVPRVGDSLHAFDVFGHTGLADGMPNVLLEAAAAGLPIVSTRVNGSEDIVRDRETGILVGLGDEAAFAEALATFYDDPARRRTVGAAARDAVCNGRFSPARMIEGFERIFERAA